MRTTFKNPLHKSGDKLALVKKLFVFTCLVLFNNLVTAQAVKFGNSKDIDLSSVYKVEIIAFAQRENIGMQMELWQKPDGLHYPDNIIKLMSQENHAKVLKIQQKRRNIVVESIAAARALSQNQNQNQNQNDSSLPAATQSGNQKTEMLDNSANLSPKSLSSLPPLLTALTSKDRQLNAMATSLRRRSGFRVLFHEGWYQQLGSTKSSHSILINAGDSFDQNRELQGSVTFSKGRFLHLQADLWLSDFIFNNGSQNENNSTYFNQDFDSTEHSWLSQKIDRANPKLPTPPKTQSLITTPIDLPTLFQNSNVDLISFSTQGKSLLRERGLLSKAGKNIDYSQDKYNQSDDLQSLLDSLTRSNRQPEIAASSRQYRANHIYVLSEHRKIRRDQIHYLDHPHFGLIAIISKYEPPNSETQGE